MANYPGMELGGGGGGGGGSGRLLTQTIQTLSPRKVNLKVDWWRLIHKCRHRINLQGGQ